MSSKERSGEASRAENLDADLRLVLSSELSMFFSTSRPEDFVVLHGPALHIRAEAGEITSR